METLPLFIGLLPALIRAESELGKVTLKVQLIRFNTQTEVQRLSETQYLNMPWKLDYTNIVPFVLTCIKHYRVQKDLIYRYFSSFDLTFWLKA